MAGYAPCAVGPGDGQLCLSHLALVTCLLHVLSCTGIICMQLHDVCQSRALSASLRLLLLCGRWWASCRSSCSCSTSPGSTISTCSQVCAAVQTLAGILWAFVRLDHKPQQRTLELSSRWTASYLLHPDEVCLHALLDSCRLQALLASLALHHLLRTPLSCHPVGQPATCCTLRRRTCTHQWQA